MGALAQALATVRRPVRGFRELADGNPPLGRSTGRMLAWWLPVAYAHGALTAWSFLGTYQALRAGHLPWWTGLLPPGSLDPEVLRDLLRGLPAPPSGSVLAGWVMVLVPLGVLGAWLHHAVWDHTCLWLLGGLGERRGFRTSLLAEAQALRISALGSVLALLGFLPKTGWLLALPLAGVEAFFWIFRGFSLAAFHRCPTWKGVAATVLHLALVGCLAGGLLGLVLLLSLRA